jgi:hypothetical protein
MSAAAGLPSREKFDQTAARVRRSIPRRTHAAQLNCFSSLRTQIPSSQFLIGFRLDVRVGVAGLTRVGKRPELARRDSTGRRGSSR